MQTSPGISRNFDEPGRMLIEKEKRHGVPLVIVQSIEDTHVIDSQVSYALITDKLFNCAWAQTSS